MTALSPEDVTGLIERLRAQGSGDGTAAARFNILNQAADALAALSATRSAIRREALEEAAKVVDRIKALAEADSHGEAFSEAAKLEMHVAGTIARLIRSLADKEPQA